MEGWVEREKERKRVGVFFFPGSRRLFSSRRSIENRVPILFLSPYHLGDQRIPVPPPGPSLRRLCRGPRRVARRDELDVVGGGVVHSAKVFFFDDDDGRERAGEDATFRLTLCPLDSVSFGMPLL